MCIFVAEKTLLEAIASSLTELFSPLIIGERIEGMLKHYDFVTTETLAYFSARPPQARARTATLRSPMSGRTRKTPEQQALVLKALEFKCDVLWGDARCALPRLRDAQAHFARRLRAGGQMKDIE